MATQRIIEYLGGSHSPYLLLAHSPELGFGDHVTGRQVGKVPPFGNLFGVETYVDCELATNEQIFFNAGTHTHAVTMRFEDYLGLAHPKLLRIAGTAATPIHAVMRHRSLGDQLGSLSSRMWPGG